MAQLSVARRSNVDKFDPIDTEPFEALAERAGLAMDIADLYAELRNHLVEVERAQAREMQAAKLAGIGELSANVAHELNNPLTGVLMHLGLITEAEGLAEDVRYVRTSHSGRGAADARHRAQPA